MLVIKAEDPSRVFVRAASKRKGMRIVEAQDTRSTRSMKTQRIADAMRNMGGSSNLLDLEFDPIKLIKNNLLTVKVHEGIEIVVW